MLLNVIILAIRACLVAAENTPAFVNVVDVLLKNGGKWYLAAAGSNRPMPDFEKCIQLTITDTNMKAGCILVAHDHSIKKLRILKFHGINSANHTEIMSIGPVFQYMVKGNDEKQIDRQLKLEVDWDAAINSPICWNGHTLEMQETKYIVTPIDKSADNFYLVAVSPNTPSPEYQVAILTKTIITNKNLNRLVNIVNYRNYDQLNTNTKRPGQFVETGLPNLHIKCAKDDESNTAYERQRLSLEIEFKKNSPPYPDMETILVKHA